MWQTWNDFLASLAVTWADGCDFSHGQPPLGDNPSYTVIGQNLQAATGSEVDLTAGIQAWYDEQADYDYDTMQCTPTAVCGHYTQVRVTNVASAPPLFDFSGQTQSSIRLYDCVCPHTGTVQWFALGPGFGFTQTVILNQFEPNLEVLCGRRHFAHQIIYNFWQRENPSNSFHFGFYVERKNFLARGKAWFCCAIMKTFIRLLGRKHRTILFI